MATITQVSAITANGHYNAGEIIQIQVTFSENVIVDNNGGVPTLELATGGFATYVSDSSVANSGSGTPNLVFEYVIADGENLADLSYASTTALTTNGRRITNEGSGLDATLTLPEPGNSGSLSDNSDIVVDTEAPVFTFWSSGYDTGVVENDSLAPGESIATQSYALVFNDNFSTTTDDFTDFTLVQTAGFDDGNQLFPITLSDILDLDGESSFLPGTLESPIGTTTNTFTLTDKAGNETIYSFDLKVNDYEKPTAVLPDSYEVLLDADTIVTIDAQTLADDGVVMVDDNDDRGIASYHLLSNPDSSQEGEVAYFTVELVDDESSVFKVRVVGYDADDQVVTNGINQAIDFIYTPETDDDNGNDSNLTGPILLNLGYRVYDPSGNYNSIANGNADTIAITIKDGTAPDAIAKTDVTLELGADGTVTLTADEFDDGSTDNLGIASKAIASASDTAEQVDATTLQFDVDDLGTQAITLTVTDSGDLSDTDTQTITIVDLLDPTATALTELNLALDENGEVTLAASALDSGSDDNTGSDNLTFTLNIADPAITGVTTYDFDATDVNTSFAITLTVTDKGGNAVTTITPTTVNVVDVTNPMAIAQNFEVVMGSDGNVVVMASDINNSSTDNVGIASYDISGDGGTTFLSEWTFGSLGTKAVTLRVTDTSGNTHTVDAEVLVKEETAPVVETKNITVELGEDGTASITVDDIDDGTYDPGADTGAGSGIRTLDLDRYDFSGADLGDSPITVTLTATDNSGNVSSAEAMVTVEDNLAPILVDVPDNISVEADAIPTVADVTATDNVDGAITPTLTQVTTGDDDETPYQYTITRTWTATDSQGNATSANQIITVNDTIAPTVVTQNIIVFLDENGEVTLTQTQIEQIGTGSSDSVSDVIFSLDQTFFDGDDLGDNLVTLTVADGAGNEATETATVTVEDNTDPVAAALATYTVELDATGNQTITVADVNNGSSDNDQIASLTLSNTDFTLADIGASPLDVTLTVSDRADNTATTTVAITVVDRITPTVVTQDVTLYLDQSGTATLLSSDIDNGSSDVAGIDTLTLSQETFTAADLGDNTVTLTVTDIYGNLDTGMATVTVVDNLAPIFSFAPETPQDITVEADLVPSVDAVTVTATDNADSDVIVVFNQEKIDGANINSYTLIRTWTATDDQGNQATHQQTISVGDTIAPTVSIQNLTVALDENGEVTVTAADVDAGSEDALGIASLKLTYADNQNVDALTFDQPGDFVVTLIVTDTTGNVSTGDATVTVEDAIVPILSGVPTNLDLTVEADAVPVAAIVTAMDNVDEDIVVDFDEGRVNGDKPNSYTLTRTWTAIDSSGNEAEAVQTITVQDTTAPTAIAQNITVQLDETGEITITPDQINNGSSDTVSDVTLAFDPDEFSSNNLGRLNGDHLGENTITLIVTDADGNSTEAIAIVTVEDNLAPIFADADVPDDVTVEADAIPTSPTLTATDNVDGIITALFVEVITSGDKPNSSTITRTWTATDSQGNATIAEQVITVGDTTPPTVSTQNITVQLDESGRVTIQAADIDDGSGDAVGDVSLALDQTTFDVDDLGPNTVTLTVTDEDGNSAKGTATVTVEDGIEPEAIAQDLGPLIFTGNPITITAADVDNGSNDNTSQFTLTLDFADDVTDVPASSLTFNAEGIYTVNLTATDGSGNTATTTAAIEIIEKDIVPPEAIAQNFTAILDANGTVTLTVDNIDNGSSDNVGIISRSLSQYTFTAAHLFQDNEITLTIEDAEGNQDTDTAIVTIVDETAPTVTTQNIEVSLNAIGTAMITASDIDNGSRDNVAIASRTLDISEFSASDLTSPVTVTLTVTDTSGNFSQDTATITVLDQTNPIASAKNITVALDENGDAAISVDDIDSGSADNVAIASLELDRQAFTIDDLGQNPVTLTATDTSGNQSTDNAIITVIDNLAPIVATNDATLSLDENGTATLTVADIDNGSRDNGNITSTSLSQTNFTTADLGQPQTVTLTLIDQSGNQASNMAQVTVVDDLAPTVITQDVLLYLDANDQATLSPDQVNNGSSDNVEIDTVELDRTEFTAADIGVQTVTLTVTDTSGNTASQTAEITVEAAGPPTPLTGQVFSVAENSPIGTFVGAVQGQTILGRLQDWQVTTPDLDNDSAPTVRIERNTGYLWVTDVDELDFESQSEMTVNVTVSNGIERSRPISITLSLTDQNDAPSIQIVKQIRRLSEDTDTSQRLKVAEIEVLDDALGSETVAIAGTDPTPFEIEGQSLYLKAGTVLNFDAKPQYSVVLTVDDPTIGLTPDASALFTLSLSAVAGYIPINDSEDAGGNTGNTDSDTENTDDNIEGAGGDSSPNAEDLDRNLDSDDETGSDFTTDPIDMPEETVTVDDSAPPSTDSNPDSLDPTSVTDDSLNTLAVDDILQGTRAKDRLFGWGGDDRLVGKGGNDRLIGGSGDDVLLGNGGRDRLIGGDGDDELTGNKGKDKLTGGAGADIFKYRGFKDGRDVITDFTMGEDQIDLSRLTAKIKGISSQNLLGDIVQIQPQKRHTIVSIDKDGLEGGKDAIALIKLQGIDAGALSSSDFIF